jgi:hypothetical protein
MRQARVSEREEAGVPQRPSELRRDRGAAMKGIRWVWWKRTATMYPAQKRWVPHRVHTVSASCKRRFIDRTHHIPQSRSGSFCSLGPLQSRVGREGRREIGRLTKDDCSAGEGHDESAEPDPRSSV